MLINQDTSKVHNLPKGICPKAVGRLQFELTYFDSVDKIMYSRKYWLRSCVIADLFLTYSSFMHTYAYLFINIYIYIYIYSGDFNRTMYKY